MLKTFSFIDRSLNLDQFKTNKFDLIIIGGGINGAGVARDAAMRGLKVALVEKNDFASGTSSRSSKMIHGGLRYLENLEFRLVFESLTERQILFEIAPHLVHPLRFLIPLYKESRVGMIKMGLGLFLYDLLSLFDSPKLHEKLTKESALKRAPHLRTENFLGAYEYSDAYMDDDRLTIETLRSAHDHGALCCNYIKAKEALFDNQGKVEGIVVEDVLGGQRFNIFGRHIVSTVGPWTDEVAELFDKKWEKVLRPTKGVHLSFKKERIPLKKAVVMAAEERLVFGIPRHDMLLVGTTDTDFKDSPNNIEVQSEDVEYLLKVINKYFPGADVKSHDIIGAYAGVRPLVKDGSGTEGKTSRDHWIKTLSQGVTFMAGGKYTTYRLIAEQVVNECLSQFPIEDRVQFGRCLTRSPLNPQVTEESQKSVHTFIEDIQKNQNWSYEEAALFVQRYGAESYQLIEEFHEQHPTYWEMEALHALHNTMCLNLIDFYFRRTGLVLTEEDQGLSKMYEISRIFQKVLNWSIDELKEEERNLKEALVKNSAWRSGILV